MRKGVSRNYDTRVCLLLLVAVHTTILLKSHYFNAAATALYTTALALPALVISVCIAVLMHTRLINECVIWLQHEGYFRMETNIKIP